VKKKNDISIENDDTRIGKIEQVLPPIALLEKYPASNIAAETGQLQTGQGQATNPDNDTMKPAVGVYFGDGSSPAGGAPRTDTPFPRLPLSCRCNPGDWKNKHRLSPCRQREFCPAQVLRSYRQRGFF